MWLAQLESLRPALAAWNRGVQAAMDDYAAHPTAACRHPSCDRLADTGDAVLCRRCERERLAAIARSQAKRGAA